MMELEYLDHLSPKLKDGIKNYLIDIDGTITDDVPNETKMILSPNIHLEPSA